MYVDENRHHGRGFRDYESELAIELTERTRQLIDVRVLNDAPVAFRYHVFKAGH